ncbi:hypothetical protein SETIT_5G105800v2 [Setaria italica]|uniref:Uncharacterized protein n=1 Tax=Setaria italica TaxID=4555 RepID=A0A368R3Q2_SETIT|nr:hypothetical protein SETIT_5G105800v2 [Setaria italica]
MRERKRYSAGCPSGGLEARGAAGGRGLRGCGKEPPGCGCDGLATGGVGGQAERRGRGWGGDSGAAEVAWARPAVVGRERWTAAQRQRGEADVRHERVKGETGKESWTHLSMQPGPGQRGRLRPRPGGAVGAREAALVQPAVAGRERRTTAQRRHGEVDVRHGWVKGETGKES